MNINGLVRLHNSYRAFVHAHSLPQVRASEQLARHDLTEVERRYFSAWSRLWAEYEQNTDEIDKR